MNQKIKDRIERYRQIQPSESSLKKRKIARVLVFINIGLLVVLIFVFKQPVPKGLFHARVEYDSLSYTFDIKRNAGKDTLLFSSLISSTAPAERGYVYKSSIADIVLKYKDTIIYEGVVGEKVSLLRLKPGESRKLVLEISDTGILDFMEENPDAITPKRRSLLSRQQYLPLEARITINSEKPVSLVLEFNYEVQ